MSPGANTRNLVILGMHRSGTSMVAGALAAAGIYAGESEELLAAQADNPRGFWERRDVFALNDRLLASTGSSWFKPGTDAIVPDADSVEEMNRILQRLGGKAWLLKDPRLLLTWPAWEAHLQDALLVYVYRAAPGVVNSLEQRNGLPLDYGLALWQYYNLQALQLLQGREFVALSYEQFSARPEQEFAALVQRLEQHGVALGGATAVADLFDRTLDHTPAADNPVPGLMSAAQRSLHEACAEVVTTGSLPAASVLMDTSLSVRIASMANAYSRVVEAQQVAQQLEQESLELEAARNKLQLLLQHHDELLAEHEALAQAHQRDNEELLFLRTSHEELLCLRDTHEELERTLERTVERSEQALTEAEAKSDYLFHQLDLSYHKLLSFTESGLGGLYRGIAAIYKLLTGQRSKNTAFDDVLFDAREHFSHYPRPVVSGEASRLRLLTEVLRYVLANPAGSLRSFSWPRLKRALSIFRDAEREDLALWVKQRFPAADEMESASLLPELGEELDSLRLAFTPCENPRVSIIVPVFNHYRMTLFCLRSILEHTGELQYELILADDASTDLTTSIEQRVAGLVLERASANQGFVRNCNAGARRARGDYLVFLNNDVGLTPGWLQTLVATLDEHAGAAVVGPKLLYGNGALQEAGGIVWDDASGWNYGRLDDAGKPEYNYLREVDYVSGACLLVRNNVWQQLGGFDTRFVPAYYEDTDLCFAAREAGFTVLYQPAATVFHFEGISNGTDLQSGIKHYQLENQVKFADKWQAVLKARHFPNAQSVFQARDRSRDRRTILVIDHYVPSFDKDAGSRSTWLYLQLFVEMGYNVKFIGANFFPHQPYTRALQQLGIEVLVGEGMARNLDRWLQQHSCDIHAIYLHRPHVAEQFLGSLQKMQPRPTLVYFGHDLHYLRKERQLELQDDPVVRSEASDWRRREYKLFEAMDHIYYPSQVEVDEIKSNRPDASVQAIPLYVLEESPLPVYSASEREGMLFVGGFNHPPNSDGVLWFIESVLPLVRQQAPDLELHIVGSSMPEDIQQLAEQGVVVHGYLDDAALLALYQRMKMVVVPLRYGAGVKGKVIEALQQGVPLVVTSVGAEGLPEAQQVMHIADAPESFAEKILAVEVGGMVVDKMLQRYPAYLSSHFSKARASELIIRDFGAPLLESL